MTAVWHESGLLFVALLLLGSCRSARSSESDAKGVRVDPPGQRTAAQTAPAPSRPAPEPCEPQAALENKLAELPHDCARVSFKDYSADQSSSVCTCVVAPSTEDEVKRAVRAAVETQTPVRVRGGAHSANHSTFPNAGELVLSTARLAEVAWDSPDTVSAGAGVPVVALSRRLGEFGLMLPVVNDGWSGPTVGGYISAGGMGSGSGRYGGFWENVASVTLVTLKGETVTLSRKDADFPWLFGSMGQLGVIVRARLDVVPQSDEPSRDYEPGVRFQLATPNLDRVGQTPLSRGPDMQENLRWFTLLVEKRRLDEARADLQRLQQPYASRLRFRNVYEYPFAFRRRNPPLFFGRNVAFVGIGIWADLDGRKDVTALTDLERDFSKMVLEKDYRRYIQSEVTRGPAEFERYFGSALYERFRSVKRRYDPHGLLNPGVVFR